MNYTTLCDFILFRILAFSIDSIKHVLVQLDKEIEWRNCNNVENSPLYVTEWNVDKYSSGLHIIKVCYQNFKTLNKYLNFINWSLGL